MTATSALQTMLATLATLERATLRQIKDAAREGEAPDRAWVAAHERRLAVLTVVRGLLLGRRAQISAVGLDITRADALEVLGRFALRAPWARANIDMLCALVRAQAALLAWGSEEAIGKCARALDGARHE